MSWRSFLRYWGSTRLWLTEFSHWELRLATHPPEKVLEEIGIEKEKDPRIHAGIQGGQQSQDGESGSWERLQKTIIL